jgi:protein-S-isoprenylcysteine O-methyltransferase Ste14
VSRFSKRYADTVARLRVPMGFVLLAAFLILARPTLRSVFWGLPIAACGLFLRGWAAGHLAKNQELITSGPYAWLRNPLYAGTFIVAMGLSVAAKQPVLAWLYFLVFYFVYLPVIQLEEQHLATLFPGFREYAKKVRMLWPTLPDSESPGTFRWELYQKNQEWKALLAFLIAIGYLFWRAAAAT